MRRVLTETVFILVYLPFIYADSWFAIKNSITENIPQSSASEINAIPTFEGVPVLPSSDDDTKRITDDFSTSLTSSNEDFLSSSFADKNMSVADDSDTELSALLVSSVNVTTTNPHTMILSKRSIARKNQIRGNYSLQHLMAECPNTDICFRKAPPKSYSSNRQCCLSCSCDPRCTMIGNCCDKSIMGNESMCHWAVVQKKERSYGNPYEYFIIDKCLNSWNSTDCKAIESEPWGSFFPVYDATSDLIFYNKHCAECSGVETYMPWNLNIICRTPYFTNDILLYAFQGKQCEISFTPPPQVELEKHICSTSLISRCNVSGFWSKYDAWLEEACLRWYSPVPNTYGKLLYSNIYCQRCNGDVMPNIPCNFVSGSRGPLAGSYYALLIDYRKIGTLTRGLSQNTEQHALDRHCGEDMVKHPFKEGCRYLLCPVGFIRIEGICKPISTSWLYDQYFVQLEMTPVMNQLHVLPMSDLDSLSEEERNQPNIWFDAKGAPLDYFELFVETSENNKFVKKLIVRIGRSRYPLNVAKETNSIRKAISQEWEINSNGKTFKFTVQFDKYASFVYDGVQQKINVVDFVMKEKTVKTEKAVKRVNVFTTKPKRHLKTFVLRKTNFCERVRLLATEWTGGFQEIRLDSSIAREGADKILGDSEFDIFLDDLGKVVVDICAEDFDQDYKMHKTSDAIPIVYNSNAMFLFVFLLSGW